MRRIITMLVAAFSITNAFADHLEDRLVFSARLNGGNQAPTPVTTNASGVAGMMLNSTRDTLWVNIAVTGLGNSINGIHIHKGAAGTNGNVVLDLLPKLNKNIVRTYITGTMLNTIWSDLMNDMLYLNVHTTANPNGEIRGQIMLEREYGIGASLDGAQAGNMSVTAKGSFTMAFTQRTDSVWFRLQTSGLSGKILAIHLHQGALMQNGGVLFDLGAFLRADSMGLSGGRAITGAERDTLAKYIAKNEVYINVHTASFGAGEIRGQLDGGGLRFDAVLDPAQIIAGGGSIGTPSNGWGVANVSMNINMDQITYDIVFDNLSSAVSAAHFHNAVPTASGSVVKPLTVNGNRISGTWSKADGTQPLTDQLISELLKGNIYVVVHTTANGGGELRGNISRLAREGFICEIDAQQAGTTAPAAMGGGIVTYNRARTDLHYMFAADGLSGPIVSAHLHKAIKGQNGGVVYDLSSSFVNNAAYGYWSPFSNAASIPLRSNDSIYINIHTSANPNGEIRGQLMRNYRISSETVKPNGIAKLKSGFINYSVYPNPVAENASLKLEAVQGKNMETELYDLQGRKVWSMQINSAEPNTEIVIPMQQLPEGIYILSVLAEGQRIINEKIIK